MAAPTSVSASQREPATPFMHRPGIAFLFLPTSSSTSDGRCHGCRTNCSTDSSNTPALSSPTHCKEDIHVDVGRHSTCRAQFQETLQRYTCSRIVSSCARQRAARVTRSSPSQLRWRPAPPLAFPPTLRSCSIGRDRWRERSSALAKRRAVEQALAQLQPDDRFALVVYDDNIDVLAESTLATAEAKRGALARLAGVEPRGYHGSGGVDGCGDANR